MNLITLENISKAYGQKVLLDRVDLSINERDKIGLIGLNGSGKTTLLKIIAGIKEPDSGQLVENGRPSIEYLPQVTDFKDDLTVIEQVFRGNSENIRLVRRYEEALNRDKPDSEEILRLTEEMDKANAWELEAEAKTILTKLGIRDFKAKIGSLSGGQKRRISLASSLINPSDLLILDEPTNHIDDLTIEWLEEYLKARKSAILMITHDRYFLDKVTDRIFELDRGKIYSYEGNYNYYLEKKVEREESLIASERKRKSLYRQELAWVKRGVRARGTKQKARLERFEELKESKLGPEREELDISISGQRLGKKIIELDKISKSFGNKKIIDSFSYTLLRDDRIGILGKNGAGKSTLLNIIGGRIEPDSGSIDLGETVRIGYFSQETDHMDKDMRAIEYVEESQEWIETSDGTRITAAKMMERFLFTKDEQWIRIADLSGGEKRRLNLLKMLMTGPNVLLLDEPTNDLDIKTLAVLEEYIDEFTGPVLIVSHDRYLLDKIADKVFVFEGQGKIEEYTGNYSFFREKYGKYEEDKKVVKKAKPKEKPRNRKLKLSYKEEKEWETIDEDIARLEEGIKDLEEAMLEWATDYVKLQELGEKKEDLEGQLEDKMDRWLYLSELLEKIENQ